MEIAGADRRLSLAIYEAANRIVPRKLLEALEVSGDGRIWIPIPIAVLLTVRSPPSVRLAAGLLAGFLLDLLLVGLLKHFVRRPRPSYNRGMYRTVAVDHWSFPSGHSSRALFISAFLFLVRSSVGEISAVGFLPAAFIWSTATASSRILLGRHYLFDVLAGGLLGLIEALLVFRFFDYF